MQRLIVYLISLAMALGGFAARAAGDTKAEQLLAQARAALGGATNLNKVQGLTAAGTYQREMGDRQVSGEITIVRDNKAEPFRAGDHCEIAAGCQHTAQVGTEGVAYIVGKVCRPTAAN